jgi:hypothetical protein
VLIQQDYIDKDDDIDDDDIDKSNHSKIHKLDEKLLKFLLFITIADFPNQHRTGTTCWLHKSLFEDREI